MSPNQTEPPTPSWVGSSSWMADRVSQWGSQGLKVPVWHILHTNWSTDFLQSPNNQLKQKVRIRNHFPQHTVRSCYLPCPRAVQVQPSSWPHSVWWLPHGSATGRPSPLSKPIYSHFAVPLQKFLMLNQRDEPTPERGLVPEYGQKVTGSHYVLWLHLFIIQRLFFVKQYLRGKRKTKKTSK